MDQNAAQGLPRHPARQEPHPAREGTGRPPMATWAAVLAFAQAGITAVPTMIVFALGGDTARSQAPDGVVVALAAAQSAGFALLVLGGALLITGKSRWWLVAASVAQVGICAAYPLVVPAVDNRDHWVFVLWGVVGPLLVLAFAVLPVISLFQALTREVGEWLRGT
ncbi:hypothetical protein ACOBQX_09585 [Actinokineospora sp. G85]|uniref:hypothetical protein n=1 Tax=Actinokineospora sp. G85 TaxID=3406626 RepID=UPI003C70EE5D